MVNEMCIFDTNKKIWYNEYALMRKSNYNIYISELGIVWTNYKFIEKEHLGANYRKDNPSRLVRRANRYQIAMLVRAEKEITEIKIINL